MAPIGWAGMEGFRIDAGAVAAATPDGTFVVDALGVVTWANVGCVEILGWPIDTFVGSNVLDHVHPDDVPLVLSSLDSMRTKEVGLPVELRVRRPSGGWRWVEIIARNLLDDPAVRGMVCSGRDLTTRRMWEVTHGDGARMEQVLHHAPGIVMLLDGDGAVTGTNGAFTRLLGHDPSDVVGRRLATFGVGDDGAGAIEAALEDVRRYGAASVEVTMARSGGREGVPIRFELVDLLDDPVVAGVAVTGHDVTELQDARSLLEHLATHDSLTDLPNRALLARRLGQLLAEQRPLALFYVDLDRFKPVNDRYGHAAGDEVLRHVAERLRGEVSAADVVARVGGDEFVVLAVGVTSAEAAIALGRRLEDAVEAPYALDVGIVCVGASVGVALAGAGSSADSLLHEADDAMYLVKHA